MNKKIYTILEKIELLGYEAYIVGGYVRDFLLNKESCDVDIAASATIESLLNLFPDSKVYNEFACIKFKQGIYNISITSYRKEYEYKNNKPTRVEYSESLLEDSLRRDFTINAIYMNKEGIITDPQNGVKDLNNKIIRIIGDASIRLKEDANRILRSFRFMSILDFTLDKDLLAFMFKNKYLIKNINYERRKEELDKIFSDKNFVIFLNFIKNKGFSEYFDLSYDRVVYCDNYLGVWAQIYFGEKYNFNKRELEKINAIKSIIKNDTISNTDMFNNGLEVSLIAAQILNINSAEIKLRYKKLPIKKTTKIDIEFKEIEKIFNNKDINKIYNKIIEDIVEGKLKNKYNNIKKYLESGGFNG